jgi:hypothetical protein
VYISPPQLDTVNGNKGRFLDNLMRIETQIKLIHISESFADVVIAIDDKQ